MELLSWIILLLTLPYAALCFQDYEGASAGNWVLLSKGPRPSAVQLPKSSSSAFCHFISADIIKSISPDLLLPPKWNNKTSGFSGLSRAKLLLKQCSTIVHSLPGLRRNTTGKVSVAVSRPASAGVASLPSGIWTQRKSMSASLIWQTDFWLALALRENRQTNMKSNPSQTVYSHFETWRHYKFAHEFKMWTGWGHGGLLLPSAFH